MNHAKGKGKKAGKRATVTQVAELAGVAPTTVSAVLNQRESCYASEATRQRILDAAQKLDYRPNLAARALWGGASNSLALIVDTLAAEVNNLKARAFDQVSRKMGYLTFLSYHPNNPETEDALIRASLDRYVDGIVIYPSHRGEHRELRKLVDRKFPVVTINGAGILDFETVDVSPDFAGGGRLQAEHLLETGCRRIGLIHLEMMETLETGDLRRVANIEVLHQAGCTPVASLLLPPPDCTPENLGVACYGGIRAFLKQHGREMDGIIASNDFLAAAIVRACLELGIHVPDDLAVIGLDGIALTRNFTIPLSTVVQPAQEIGEEAFRLIKAQIDGEEIDPASRQVKLPLRLEPNVSTMGSNPEVV